MTHSKDNEHFQYNYLPAPVARVLGEAFSCYNADLKLAFAMLCRLAIARAEAHTSNKSTRPFETLFDDACRLADVDAATRRILTEVLFGNAAEPDLTADQAAFLVELLKDIFQQHFVRPAKLRRAIEMRRFFASEQNENVTPIDSFKSRTTTHES